MVRYGNLRSLILALIGGLTGFPVVGAAAADGFPLVCNGNGMSVSSEGGNTIVFFLAGTAAAGTTPPGPGQCAWLDRPFRPGEPTRLVIPNNVPGAGDIANIVNSGGTFFVRAFNNNAGAMVVTHVGP